MWYGRPPRYERRLPAYSYAMLTKISTHIFKNSAKKDNDFMFLGKNNNLFDSKLPSCATLYYTRFSPHSVQIKKRFGQIGLEQTKMIINNKCQIIC